MKEQTKCTGIVPALLLGCCSRVPGDGMLGELNRSLPRLRDECAGKLKQSRLRAEISWRDEPCDVVQLKGVHWGLIPATAKCPLEEAGPDLTDEDYAIPEGYCVAILKGGRWEGSAMFLMGGKSQAVEELARSLSEGP